MAKSTSNPNREVPKGMMRFEVIRSNIKDSVGQYCVPGDFAILTKEHAQGYLDSNHIKVALPDFGELDGEEDVHPDDSDAEDASLGAETPLDTRKRARQGGKRASSD